MSIGCSAVPEKSSEMYLQNLQITQDQLQIIHRIKDTLRRFADAAVVSQALPCR